jgi:hypothetical protein
VQWWLMAGVDGDIQTEAHPARPMHVRLKRERDQAARSDDEEDGCRRVGRL